MTNNIKSNLNNWPRLRLIIHLYNYISIFLPVYHTIIIIVNIKINYCLMWFKLWCQLSLDVYMTIIVTTNVAFLTPDNLGTVVCSPISSLCLLLLILPLTLRTIIHFQMLHRESAPTFVDILYSCCV